MDRKHVLTITLTETYKPQDDGSEYRQAIEEVLAALTADVDRFVDRYLHSGDVHVQVEQHKEGDDE